MQECIRVDLIMILMVIIVELIRKEAVFQMGTTELGEVERKDEAIIAARRRTPVANRSSTD